MKEEKKNLDLVYTWLHTICWQWPYREVALQDRRKGIPSRQNFKQYPLFTIPEETKDMDLLVWLNGLCKQYLLNRLMNKMVLSARIEIIPWLNTDFPSSMLIYNFTICQAISHLTHFLMLHSSLECLSTTLYPNCPPLLPSLRPTVASSMKLLHSIQSCINSKPSPSCSHSSSQHRVHRPPGIYNKTHKLW